MGVRAVGVRAVGDLCTGRWVFTDYSVESFSTRSVHCQRDGSGESPGGGGGLLHDRPGQVSVLLHIHVCSGLTGASWDDRKKTTCQYEVM